MSVTFAVANEMIIAVSPNCDKVVMHAKSYGIVDPSTPTGGLLHAAPKGGLMPGTHIWAVCAAQARDGNVERATTLMFYGGEGYKLAERIQNGIRGKVMFIGILTETYHYSNPYIHVNLCPTPRD